MPIFKELWMHIESSTELFTESGPCLQLYEQCLNWLWHPESYLKHCKTQGHCWVVVSSCDPWLVPACSCYARFTFWLCLNPSGTRPLACFSTLHLAYPFDSSSAYTILTLAWLLFTFLSYKLAPALPACWELLPVWLCYCLHLLQALWWHPTWVPVLQLQIHHKFELLCWPGLTTGTHATLCPVLPFH